MSIQSTYTLLSNWPAGIFKEKVVLMQMRFGHFGPPRILVVDNDPTIVESTVATLGMHGYEVQGAYSGEDAVAEAVSFEPDLLISDIPMVGMNGIEAALQITDMFPGCRVIFHSNPATLTETEPFIPEALLYSIFRKSRPVQELIDCLAILLSAVEPFERQRSSSHDDHVASSTLNDWRWTFRRYPSVGVHEATVSSTVNIPDARSVRLDSGPLSYSSLTIQ